MFDVNHSGYSHELHNILYKMYTHTSTRKLGEVEKKNGKQQQQ